MKVKSESEVAQSCSTLCDPMDYSLPGSSVHRIFQARVLEWGASAFSELRASMPQLKNPHAATKTQHSQINKNFFFFKKFTTSTLEEPIQLP